MLMPLWDMKEGKTIQGCNQVRCPCWSPPFRAVFIWETSWSSSRSSSSSWHCSSRIAYCKVGNFTYKHFIMPLIIIIKYYRLFFKIFFLLYEEGMLIKCCDGLQIFTGWPFILFSWPWEKASSWWGLRKLAWVLPEHPPYANGAVT